MTSPPEHPPSPSSRSSSSSPSAPASPSAASSGSGDDLDKSADTIQSMFARVAPRYDLLNRLMTGFLDSGWRRRTAAALDRDLDDAVEGSPAPDAPVLDLCCGTGDQALALERRRRRVVAADFCVPMLALAHDKFERRRAEPRPERPPRHGGDPPGLDVPAPLTADALGLPFASERFAGVSVSFGIRNVADLDRALAEIHRVLLPGGRVAILEAAVPVAPVVRPVFRLYSRWVLPSLGKLLSPAGSAYEYLPASVSRFPSRDVFVERLESVGFDRAAWDELAFGTVCLYRARKPR